MPVIDAKIPAAGIAAGKIEYSPFSPPPLPPSSRINENLRINYFLAKLQLAFPIAKAGQLAVVLKFRAKFSKDLRDAL